MLHDGVQKLLRHVFPQSAWMEDEKGGRSNTVSPNVFMSMREPWPWGIRNFKDHPALRNGDVLTHLSEPHNPLSARPP